MAATLINHDGTVETEQDSVAHQLEKGEFFWLDLEQPSEAELAMLRDTFSLHELAVEDASKFNQRPKIEEYDDFTYLVCYGAHGEHTELELTEVHLIYSDRFLITIHQGDCKAFNELRSHNARRVQKAAPIDLLHLVVDALVDSFFPQIEDLDDQIDELENDIFDGPNKDQLQRVSTMKRQLGALKKIVGPQRDMFGGLLAGRYEISGLDTDTERYFRDVYDHLLRVSDEIDTYRDLLSGAKDVYMSTVANQQGEVGKQLAVIASFFLPLSFLTGFYGQNFGWLADHIGGVWWFSLLGVGSMVASTVAFIVYFRKRGWF